MIKKILTTISKKKRDKILRNEIQSLGKESFSIISSDCIGGILYHDLHKKFTSPTINLSFFDNTFLIFCKNIEYYLSKELIFIETKKPHPVAIINGRVDEEKVKINFAHYRTKEEAVERWNERKSRIDLRNLFFIYNTEKIDKATVSLIDELVTCGLCFFVICRENISGVDRSYIHESNYLKKHPKKAGKLLSYKFMSGKRNFDDLGIYNFIIEKLKK